MRPPAADDHRTAGHPWMPLDAAFPTAPHPRGHVRRKKRSEHRGSRNSPTKTLPPLPAVRNKAENLPDRVTGSTRGNRSTEKYSGTIPADTGPTRIGRATTPRGPHFWPPQTWLQPPAQVSEAEAGMSSSEVSADPAASGTRTGASWGGRRAGLPRGGGISMRFGQPVRPIHLLGESGLVAVPVPVSRRVSRPTPW